MSAKYFVILSYCIWYCLILVAMFSLLSMEIQLNFKKLDLLPCNVLSSFISSRRLFFLCIYIFSLLDFDLLRGFSRFPEFSKTIMSLANRDSFQFSLFPSVCLLFPFLTSLHWLELQVICWIAVVRVDIFALFPM